MKKFYTLLLLIPILLFTGCQKSDTASNPVTGDETGVVIINGEVVDFSTGSPVANAAISLTGSSSDTSINKSAVSDASGKYTFEFTLKAGLELAVVARKEGFVSDSTKVFAVANRTITASKLLLKATGSGGSGTRNPASLYLLGTSVPKIGIKGAGGLESVQLVFQVVDSLGVALDLDNAVNVGFVLAASPGSGTVLNPPSTRTNADGQASVVLTSGTKAGVVQVTAAISVGTKIITSNPVAVTIHGGLPDLAHFSCVPAILNIPGYNIYGVEDIITAYVGDKYSNPVRPGTAVYFSTEGGIIEGSALTSTLGAASVTLYSANPLPNHPVFGPGFAAITAATIDESFATIRQSTLVLFSGIPLINCSPFGFDIPNGSSQLFNYTVMDQNGNPLTEGTSITVEGEGKDFILTGDKEVTLPDTQSRAWTTFSFSVSDAVDTVAAVNRLVITIKSDGENGKSTLIFSGIVR